MLERITYTDIARFTWHVWRRDKTKLALCFAGMGLAAFIDTLFPLVAGYLINAITTLDPAQMVFSGALLWAFIAFVGLDVFYHGIRNGTMYIWNDYAVQNLYKIVTDSFAKVQQFSTEWHANNFAGGTVRKITRGMWSFDLYEDILHHYLWPTSVVLVSTVILLALKWPIMGLLTFVMSAIYVGFTIWAVMKVNAPRFKESADADTKVGAALADAITANSAVKAFGRERAEEARFGGITGFWRSRAIHSWQMANTMDLLRRYLSVMQMGAMVGLAIWLWGQGRATAGDVVYVFTAYMVLSAYLRHIGEQISNLQRAMSEMEDIVWFWKTGIAVEDKPDADGFMSGAGEIVFDKVTFTYQGQRDPLYQDFSLRIAPGEKVALVGHSGSGKSTFVKLVQRLYDIDSGEIRIDGQNIADVTQSSLRSGLALVPQEPILFHRKLAENIAYGKPGASQEEIEDAARRAYAHDFISALPQGYDTLVGERGIKLSGGERQRVAIARAILADAKILILDEATSSLDSVSEHEIQKALAHLMEGRTTITIAHRLATIKAVDRILVFDKGRIVEQGTHAGLVKQEGSYYKKLFDMQALELIGNDYSLSA